MILIITRKIMKEDIMKKKLLSLMLAVSCVAVLSACGKETASTDEAPVVVLDLNGSDQATATPDQQVVEDENHEGMYRSELTNLWIDEDLRNQRPVAIMVDNEITAYDHYGINSADVVYEIMNSTLNGRITRFMCIVKDWEQIEQFGSIRSVRPTNFYIAWEYNAIVIHDGGPYYINDYVAKPYTDNLSGGFARFSNGKNAEFTEYVTYDDYTNPTTGKSYPGLASRLESGHIDTEYNNYYVGPHWAFSDNEIVFSNMYQNVETARKISLPFSHTTSTLTYNETTKLYEYSAYGQQHIDPMDDNKVLAFKNIILQNTSHAQLDEHGYLIYNVLGSGDGYLITNGEAIKITWEKLQDYTPVTYRNAETGEIIRLNTGKTYVSLIPSDSWSGLRLN